MNAPLGIRLLLVDVDGTLLTADKTLTPAASQAIGELRRAGIAMTIVSSRPPRGMQMLIKPLGLDCVMAGLNGGVYFNADLSIIRSYQVDPAAAKRAVDLMQSGGVDVWIFTERDWLVRDRKAPHVESEVSILKFEPKVVTQFSDDQLKDAVKIVGVSDDSAKIAGCEVALAAALDGAASVTKSQVYYVEVTDSRANKGAVVMSLSASLNIPVEEIATIGDMPTDALMFHKSGFSIAMGNASDDVKAQASVVTDSNENDGFAKAVRRYVLRRVPSEQAV
jgi:Cof subfamily protein (haloacid dehalogenase superfamily)